MWMRWFGVEEAELPSELNNEGYCDFNSRPNENSYCYQLLQELNEQRKKGILCDVNIVVSGRVFRAHKNILVAGSRFFKTLYCFTNKESRNQTTVTYLDVVAVQGFSVILDFLYSGNLVLTSQNAIEVMSVASYLQMTEVVQSCRNFIKDALNISIKSEAPETVVVDYNRRSVSRDGLSPRDQKVASFWATRNLTNLASSIKTENDPYPIDEGQMESYQMNDCSWVQDSSPEMAENESQGRFHSFICSLNAKEKVEEGGVESWKNVKNEFVASATTSSDFKYGLLPGTSNDFKYGLLPGTSSDFKYGLLPDKSQPGGQEGADQVQDTDFPRDEEYEENEVGEGDEELGDDVEEQNDQSRWDEGGEKLRPVGNISPPETNQFDCNVVPPLIRVGPSRRY
ncbi:hypothetical protein IHE44_0001094 [Lamprotornis superbus]|uniref:BTB domain-containing protein n=1 Tax=Lamprotornis superbus TaxID=245042 RepID=A0A835TUH9_9PASS|nr:hypothetical protein IHE44_0001094 [Lamprotornis superbus]